MAQIWNTLTISNVTKMWYSNNSHSLQVGRQNGTVTLNSLTSSFFPFFLQDWGLNCFVLAKQMLYFLSCTFGILCSGYFGDKV
jgi:hypothetical protein